MQILNGSLTAALMTLNTDIIQSPTLYNEGEPEVLAAAVYLLSATVNELGNQTVEPVISQVCVWG